MNVHGARALETLKDGDKILISEGCTHHRQCEDIGTVKIPRWLHEHSHKEIELEFTSGTEFPDDLSKYKCVVLPDCVKLTENDKKALLYGDWDSFSGQVFTEFITMYPVRLAEAAFMFVTVFYALKGVIAIINGHCGYIPETMSETYRTSRLEAIRKEICVKVYICLACALLTAVIGGLYELILSFDLFISPIWWIFNFAASAIFFVSSLYMFGAVNEEVESRYMLD